MVNCQINLGKSLFLLFLTAFGGVIITLSLPSLGLAGHSSLDELHNRINMEEMKIRGDIQKPQIMYIIPRSDLKVGMIMNDDYPLPQAASSETISEPEQEGPADFKKIFQASLCKSLPHLINSGVEKGSCISCHYLEMSFPCHFRNTNALTKEINQLCLNCHPSNYNHICWKEIEKEMARVDGEKDFQDGSHEYSNDEVFTVFLCQKCHPAWIKSTSGRDIAGKSAHFHWKREYNTDKFCKTCHSSKVY